MLSPAEIINVRFVGLGHRVCVDICSILKKGREMQVGNSSSFTFLVHAKTEGNPYVAPRPFSINAGAAHFYVVRPNARALYLKELKTGDEVLTNS